MTSADNDPKPTASPSAREARLAKALRENLRRRKVGAGEGEAKTTSDKQTR